ncbi:thiamine phosphate synthase [Anaerosacchariphilus polymeriproducens]|uniref:Thiamine phosphate synthase n=1 Tax=Anaerosacchariphilus polymeriproducens TaxID=1812858 RepID=A0A371ASS1_9FIRM|nr:thiamine phosphate synthase [Anaerosacchariphilus polymeriproducens]RDU22626.1 thiamine phosphate synthase [Anaerosacchariphilus polymeriproducens]
MMVVTSSRLCKDNFFDRIEKISRGGPEGIILREKEMNQEEYKITARRCAEICHKYKVPLIINHQVEIARELEIKRIHLSYGELIEYVEPKEEFSCMGVSVHSVEEAVKAAESGADYLVAGHIFETDCKKDLEPRGPGFLKNVCEHVKIPVYAIGGIRRDRLEQIYECNAAGVCVMSELMLCQEPDKVVADYEKEWKKIHELKEEIQI